MKNLIAKLTGRNADPVQAPGPERSAAMRPPVGAIVYPKVDVTAGDKGVVATSSTPGVVQHPIPGYERSDAIIVEWPGAVLVAMSPESLQMHWKAPAAAPSQARASQGRADEPKVTKRTVTTYETEEPIQ